MTEGSVQLRRYLKVRREGMSMTSAAMFAPMSLAEARLTDNDMAKGLLDHITTDEMPSPICKPATEAAPVEPAIQRESVNGVRIEGEMAVASMDGPASTLKGDTNVARGRKPKAEQVEQVIAPDFDLAVKIYHGDIKPAQSKVGEHAQEMSEAYKAIKKRANIQPQAAKLAFKLDQMEESKRDDFLRSFKGLMVRLGIFMPVDLVDAAEGKGSVNEEIVPTGQRSSPKLATLPYVGDNSDLASEAAVH